MKTIIFRRFYKRMTEADYGSAIDSIIVFEKKPYQYKSVMLPREEAINKGHQVEVINTQYQCFLKIDLWLLILRFQWLTKFNDSL